MRGNITIDGAKFLLEIDRPDRISVETRNGALQLRDGTQVDVSGSIDWVDRGWQANVEVWPLRGAALHGEQVLELGQVARDAALAWARKKSALAVAAAEYLQIMDDRAQSMRTQLQQINDPQAVAAAQVRMAEIDEQVADLDEQIRQLTERRHQMLTDRAHAAMIVQPTMNAERLQYWAQEAETKAAEVRRVLAEQAEAAREQAPAAPQPHVAGVGLDVL